jgi:hypothetical protein
MGIVGAVHNGIGTPRNVLLKFVRVGGEGCAGKFAATNNDPHLANWRDPGRNIAFDRHLITTLEKIGNLRFNLDRIFVTRRSFLGWLPAEVDAHSHKNNRNCRGTHRQILPEKIPWLCWLTKP